MLEIGQQVVCIPGEWFQGWFSRGEKMPVAGAIYTIRGFDTDRVGGELGLYLAEIVNPPLEYIKAGGDRMQEASFRASRFRPVRRTSIEVFQKMLNPEPVA